MVLTSSTFHLWSWVTSRPFLNPAAQHYQHHGADSRDAMISRMPSPLTAW